MHGRFSLHSRRGCPDTGLPSLALALPLELTMGVAYAIAGLVAVALFGYLMYALLRPEKF